MWGNSLHRNRLKFTQLLHRGLVVGWDAALAVDVYLRAGEACTFLPHGVDILRKEAVQLSSVESIPSRETSV